MIHLMEYSMGRFDRITVEPGKMNGQPCIRGMRVPVRRVLLALAIYPNREDFFANYPDIEEEDIVQALEFAAFALEGEILDLVGT